MTIAKAEFIGLCLFMHKNVFNDITKSPMFPASVGVIKRACHGDEDLNKNKVNKHLKI